MVVPIWLLTGLILSASYKSQLLSILASVRYDSPMETSADILSSGMLLSAPLNTSVYHLAKASPNPNVQELMSKSEGFHYTVYKAGEILPTAILARAVKQMYIVEGNRSGG